MNTKKPTKKNGAKSKNKPIVVCDDCLKPAKRKTLKLNKFKLDLCSHKDCQTFGLLSNDWAKRECKTCKIKTVGVMVGGLVNKAPISINYCTVCNYISICDHCGYWECCGKIINRRNTVKK